MGGCIIGALLGLYIGENAEGSLKHVMDVVVSLRHIFGQLIFFLVPLVIVGFITPAIVRLGQNASKILLVAVALAYGWVWLLLLAAVGTVAGRLLWKRRRRERQAASKESENKP